MTIEQFGGKVLEYLKKVLESECQIEFREVTKNNGVCLHSIVITAKDCNVSPAIYIDEMFEAYQNGRTFKDIAYDILCAYYQYVREPNMNMEFFTQFAQAKNKLLYKLVNAKDNRELLPEVPYIEWNDLVLIFYYLFEDEQIGRATILIRNTHLKMWGINMDTLYETAQENMLRLCPEELTPIQQIVEELVDMRCNSQGEGAPMEFPEGFRIEMAQDVSMYVLSNRSRLFGASALLYAKSLKRLAEELNRNLVVLPSSVHEVLVVPDDGVTKKDFFANMVKEVNDTQVDREEILSYSIYYYDRASDQVSIMLPV